MNKRYFVISKFLQWFDFEIFWDTNFCEDQQTKNSKNVCHVISCVSPQIIVATVFIYIVVTKSYPYLVYEINNFRIDYVATLGTRLRVKIWPPFAILDLVFFITLVRSRKLQLLAYLFVLPINIALHFIDCYLK